MAPRDHKKPDYIAKENQKNIIHNENIHANIKQSIPTLKLGSNEPLKPVSNQPGGANTEWANELKTSSDKKAAAQNVDVKITPQVEKVALQYEEQFPALGAEPEEASTDVEITPQILAPETIVAAQILDEQGVSASGISTHLENERTKMQIKTNLIPSDKDDDVLEQRAHQFISAEKLRPINANFGALSNKAKEELPIQIYTLHLPSSSVVTDEKTIQYENQFPALGEEAAPQPEGSFNTNILSPHHIAQVAESANMEAPANPIPYLAHQKDPNAPIVHQVIEPAGAGEWKQGVLPKSMQKKAHEYQSQFPALGEESGIKPQAHQELDPLQNSDLLSPKIISRMAEQVIEEAPENPIPYLAHEKLVGPLEKSIHHKEAPPQDVGDWAKGSLLKREGLSSSWTVLREGSPERSHEGYKTLNSSNGPNDEVLGLLTHTDSDTQIPSKTSLSTSAGSANDLEAGIRNQFYKDIELNLMKAKELENANMHGAAINILKKSVSAIQSFTAKHPYNKSVTDTFAVMCNTELAHLYNIVREYPLANSFAQAALDIDHTNPRVIYLLGTGLIKAGHSAEGYNVLLEGTKYYGSGLRDPYFDLIDQELAKFEFKTNVRSGHIPDTVLAVRGTVADLLDSRLVKERGGMTSASSAGVFFGTGVAGGLASWFIGKEYYRVPEKKGLAYSLGIGALIGGVSLFLYSHFRKSKTGK